MPKEVVFKPPQKPIGGYAGEGLIPPKFTPNFKEFLFKHSQQIIRSDVQGGAIGSINLYSVPADHTLFITSLWLSGECGGGGAGGSAYGYLYFDSTTKGILLLPFWDDAINSNSLSETYDNPIKIQSGESIILETDNNALIIGGGFVGFLVSNRNLVSF